MSTVTIECLKWVKHTQVAKIIMGGEAAGLVGVSFEWDSVDAAIAGSNAINGDSQMLQMMGDVGVSVVRRSVLEITGEQGDRSGEFNTCLYMGGNTNTAEKELRLVGSTCKQVRLECV